MDINEVIRELVQIIDDMPGAVVRRRAKWIVSELVRIMAEQQQKANPKPGEVPTFPVDEDLAKAVREFNEQKRDGKGIASAVDS